MDSQAKYDCLARGDGGAYLRMPTGAGYEEKIWVCRLINEVHYQPNP
jgi:3'-phosphoadenosine 5'-phosphosulfate (PAPS) 3'-phosphatase